MSEDGGHSDKFLPEVEDTAVHPAQGRSFAPVTQQQHAGRKIGASVRALARRAVSSFKSAESGRQANQAVAEFLQDSATQRARLAPRSERSEALSSNQQQSGQALRDHLVQKSQMLGKQGPEPDPGNVSESTRTMSDALFTAFEQSQGATNDMLEFANDHPDKKNQALDHALRNRGINTNRPPPGAPTQPSSLGKGNNSGQQSTTPAGKLDKMQFMNSVINMATHGDAKLQEKVTNSFERAASIAQKKRDRFANPQSASTANRISQALGLGKRSSQSNTQSKTNTQPPQSPAVAQQKNKNDSAGQKAD